MNVKPIDMRLSSGDVIETLHIALDDNRDRALVFVKTVLAKQVEKGLRRH